MKDPDISGAYNNYQSATNTANEYVSAAGSLPTKLKDAINEKLDYNKDLISQKNELASKYFQAPSEARAKYADPTSQDYIFNPFQAENLVSQYTNQAYAPYQTASDVLNARTGSIQDIINSASEAFKGQVGAAEGKANLARQTYEDLLGQGRWQYEQTHKAGGGGGLADIALILDKLGIGGGGQIPETTPNKPTEPEPVLSAALFKEMIDRPEVHWRSPGGQWEFDQNTQSWVPAGGGGGSSDGFVEDVDGQDLDSMWDF